MRILTLVLAFFLSSCGVVSNPENREQWAVSFIRSIGDAALRVEGITALRKYAPEAIPIFDINNDSMITLQEFEQVIMMSATNPEYMTFVILIAYESYKTRHRRNEQ